MEQHHHPIKGLSLGTFREIVSFQFKGKVSVGPKVYIQAGLHASELPGLLVAHYLREKLLREEEGGHLIGEVVLVPVSNPVGLDQTLLTYQMGRFDFASGENFNRHFPLLVEEVALRVDSELTSNAQENIKIVRRVLSDLISNRETVRAVDSLRNTLLKLSCDADVALDLHCDCESVLHLYTHPSSIDDVMPLAALMGAHATLYALEQGNNCFDEISASFWAKLQLRLPKFPIPVPTISVAIELRGQLDVSHSLAEQDAERILDFLRVRKVLTSPLSIEMPKASHEPTPLDGTEVLVAQKPGVVVYLQSCGAFLRPGDPVVDIVDPISGESTRYCSGVEGVLFARQNRRYAMPGMDLAYIAGDSPLGRGSLLSA